MGEHLSSQKAKSGCSTFGTIKHWGFFGRDEEADRSKDQP